MRNVVLIGMPGSGKTTLGTLIAKASGRRFVDTDELVERKTRLTISEIFERHGEPYFRKLESEAAREAVNMDGAVIATGGGIVKSPENVAALRDGGLTVFIDRPVEDIAGDVDVGGRPLLKDGLKALFDLERERRLLYLDAAHVVFKNVPGLETAFSDLLDLICAQEVRRLDGYAVIGDPIAHSLSPVIHQAVFRELGICAEYDSIYVRRGGLAAFIGAAHSSKLRGFNITAPHKRDIIPLLDEVSLEARSCGAVNTVTVRDGYLTGCNTDMDGLLLAIQDVGYAYRDSRVMILGAGGAAAGVAVKASTEGAASVTIAARRIEAAEEVRDLVLRCAPEAKVKAIEMKEPELSKAVKDCDITINTIPAGSVFRLDFLDKLPKAALVYDMAYAPPKTPVLERAEELGLQIRNGLGMLVWQAILADEIYTGRSVRAVKLYKAAMDALIEKGMAI